MKIELWIPGTAQPGGSKKAFYIKKLGRAIITDDCKKNADWKQTVKLFASEQYNGVPLDGPLVVTCTFHVQRPKGHYGSGKNASVVKPSAPKYPAVKPDATKLFRSTEDALTGITWKDDALIVDQRVRKVYGTKPGALITIERAF